MVEMTISIGMENRRNIRLTLFKPGISVSKEGDLLPTFGSRSEAAATSIAIPEVKRLYVSSGSILVWWDVPDDGQILKETCTSVYCISIHDSYIPPYCVISSNPAVYRIRTYLRLHDLPNSKLT